MSTWVSIRCPIPAMSDELQGVKRSGFSSKNKFRQTAAMSGEGERESVRFNRLPGFGNILREAIRTLDPIPHSGVEYALCEPVCSSPRTRLVIEL